jgi:hypothetical protein
MTRVVQYRGSRVLRFALVAAAVLAYSVATVARAEVKIEGTLAAVRVATDQETISEVLSAFGGVFDVRYRTAIALDATAGTAYSGSFGQVISRLLNGYNYVIKTDRDSIEILVFGRRGQIVAPPDLRGADSILSRWR